MDTDTISRNTGVQLKDITPAAQLVYRADLSAMPVQPVKCVRDQKDRNEKHPGAGKGNWHMPDGSLRRGVIVTFLNDNVTTISSMEDLHGLGLLDADDKGEALYPETLGYDSKKKNFIK